MDENFRNAARRHWNDGRTLTNCNRMDNADQLYGFAAECALKSALVVLGLFHEQAHRKHINELWSKMQGTRFYSAFPGLAQLLVGTNPFADWDVRQRYFEDGYITEQVLQKHEDCARRILIAAGLYRG